MKKTFLSLTLLYSIYLIPSAAESVPEQGASDQVVAEAVGAVEYSELLPEMVKLQQELDWYISSTDRAEIIATLGILIGQGQLNKHNFQEKSKRVIAQMVTQRSFVEAQRHLNNSRSVSVANSMGGNVKAAMDIQGIKGSIVSEYSGWNLQEKVKSAAHHPTYKHDRRCNDWC